MIEWFSKICHRPSEWRFVTLCSAQSWIIGKFLRKSKIRGFELHLSVSSNWLCILRASISSESTKSHRKCTLSSKEACVSKINRNKLFFFLKKASTSVKWLFWISKKIVAGVHLLFHKVRSHLLCWNLKISYLFAVFTQSLMKKLSKPTKTAQNHK